MGVVADIRNALRNKRLLNQKMVAGEASAQYLDGVRAEAAGRIKALKGVGSPQDVAAGVAQSFGDLAAGSSSTQGAIKEALQRAGIWQPRAEDLAQKTKWIALAGMAFQLGQICKDARTGEFDVLSMPSEALGVLAQDAALVDAYAEQDGQSRAAKFVAFEWDRTGEVPQTAALAHVSRDNLVFQETDPEGSIRALCAHIQSQQRQALELLGIAPEARAPQRALAMAP